MTAALHFVLFAVCAVCVAAQSSNYLPLYMNILGCTLTEYKSNPGNYTSAFTNALWGTLSPAYPQWTKAAIVDVQGTPPYKNTINTVMFKFAIRATGSLALSPAVVALLSNSTKMTAFDASIRAAALKPGANIIGFKNGRSMITAMQPKPADFLPLYMNILGCTVSEWNANPANYSHAFQTAMWGSLSSAYPAWTQAAIVDITASLPYATGMDTVMVTFALSVTNIGSLSSQVVATINANATMTAFDASLRASSQKAGANMPGFKNARSLGTEVVPPPPSAAPTPAPTFAPTSHADFLSLSTAVLGCTIAEWNLNPANYTAAFTTAMWGSLSTFTATATATATATDANTDAGCAPDSATPCLHLRLSGVSKSSIVGVTASGGTPGETDKVTVSFGLAAPNIWAQSSQVVATINANATMTAFDASLRASSQKAGANMPGFKNARSLGTVSPNPPPTPTAAPSAGPDPNPKAAGGVSSSARTRNVVIAVSLSILALAVAAYCYFSNAAGSRGSAGKRIAASRHRDELAATDPQVVNPLTCTGEWSGAYDSSKKRSGRGIMKYSNGQQFEGFMVSGERQGTGKCTYPSGKQYFGEWDADMWHGQGILSDGEGKVISSGQWDYGSFHQTTLSRGCMDGTLCSVCVCPGANKGDLNARLKEDDRL
jgi:hypothetical protein